jgi:putative nucleotidyltransferase with HDIG domain
LENVHRFEKTNFFSIDIETLRNVSKDITFDVYLKLSDLNFAHVFSKTSGLDYKRLAQYIQKGVKELFIREQDRELFDSFIETSIDHILANPEISNEKKLAVILNMTEQNMSELFVQLNIPEETAENTKRVIKNYVQLMSDNPKTLTILLKLVSHGEYLYYHSIAVAVFSMFIGRATGQFNKRMLEVIGLGGFLHDIGCTQLPKEMLDSPKELTPADWKLMHSHTKLGLSMIEGTANIPDEVRYIVYQHHEEPGGSGYPNGLRGNAIFYPAKIVALADGFSALISRRPFRPAYSLEQAVHIVQSEKGKYDPNLVRLISSVFLRHASRGKAAA